MNGSVLKCTKCGGMKLSLDISTNKITCDKCGYNGTERESIHFDNYKAEMLEKEEDAIKKFNNFNDNDFFKIGLNG